MRKGRSKAWEADLDPLDKGRPGSYAASKAIEAIDAAAEDAYWRQHYHREPYCERGTEFEYYETAFQVGYEGRERYPHHDFDEAEAELEAEYRRRADPSDPPWEEVREAARSAWNRRAQRLGERT